MNCTGPREAFAAVLKHLQLFWPIEVFLAQSKWEFVAGANIPGLLLMMQCSASYLAFAAEAFAAVLAHVKHMQLFSPKATVYFCTLIWCPI